MNWQFRTLIAPDSIVAPLRAITDSFGPPASGMFRAGLSPTGLGPATHWISTGAMDEPFAACLPLTTYDAQGEPTTVYADPANLIALCESMDVPPPDEATINMLQQAILVTDEPWQTTVARLGLVPVTQDEPEQVDPEQVEP